MIAFLLFVLLDSRRFHVVPLAQVQTTKHTHVETCGPVVYVRKQADGDWHVTIDNGTAKVVLEIIPELPIAPPKKGQTIRARGISRIDREHGWPELHPLLWWEGVTSCR